MSSLCDVRDFGQVQVDLKPQRWEAQFERPQARQPEIYVMPVNPYGNMAERSKALESGYT